MTPGILAEVTFFPTAEGGRKGPTPASQFRCPLHYSGEFFDCCLDLSGIGPIAPGTTVQVRIEFLVPELIMPRLNPGDEFTLWDGRTVARGRVMVVLAAA